jgi:cell wall-associated NlpC family hydrolase
MTLHEVASMSRITLTGRRAPISAAIAAIAVLAAAAPGASAPTPLKQKEHQAAVVLAEVNALDIQMGRVGEQLNGAKYELSKVQARERKTRASLTIARHQYVIAQQRVVERFVALYETNAPSTTDAVLGASSLSSILDRLQLVQATNKLDQRLAKAAESRRVQLAQKEQALVGERQKQAAAVAAIAAHQHTIDAELNQRRVLLSSVQGEVQKLKAAEAARQARLAAAARARLAAELKARQEAAARAAAAAAAAKKKAATPPPAQPTTTATTTTTPVPPTTTDATTTTTTATTTTSSEPVAPPPSAPGHPEAAQIAMKYLGVPYVFGGGTPAGFDCSGLVMYVYAQLGIQLPHFAAAQYGYGVPVSRSDLQPGDLVFFDALGHVGIWIGGNELIDAPHTGAVVSIHRLTGWYASHYVGARRL